MLKYTSDGKTLEWNGTEWVIISTSGWSGVSGNGQSGYSGYSGYSGSGGPVIYDGGTPFTDFSAGFNVDCGGVA